MPGRQRAYAAVDGYIRIRPLGSESVGDHPYHLNDIDITATYELFANQRDGVLEVSIKPN